MENVLTLHFHNKEGKCSEKCSNPGKSLVISLPKVAIEEMKISEGSLISVYYDRVTKKLIVEPIKSDQAVEGVDEEFAKLVSDFIEEYKPAVDELAK